MNKTIAVVGLGYVGLPLALVSIEKGYNVIGYDIDDRKIKLLNERKAPFKDEFIENKLKEINMNRFFATQDINELKKAEIIILCVPTPIDKKYQPDYTHIIDSMKMIKSVLQENQLIILESTISPGTMETIVKPIFEDENWIEGKNYFLAHAPERIDPGNKKYNISNIPRVIGAFSEIGLERTYIYYSSIINAEIIKLKSVKEVEATKILENSFRDINIAFINEIAKSFDKMDIDIIDVIKGASSKPFGFMPFYPGCGVGGHCIPVDPYYLIEKASESGFDHKFLKLAREINNSMPKYTVDLFLREMNKIGECVKDKTVGVLGLSYKKNVGDIRESPALKIIEELKNLQAKVIVYDPYFLNESQVKSLDEFYELVDYVILATDHDAFENLDFTKFKLFIDGRNMFYNKNIKSCHYKGVGR